MLPPTKTKSIAPPRPIGEFTPAQDNQSVVAALSMHFDYRRKMFTVGVGQHIIVLPSFAGEAEMMRQGILVHSREWATQAAECLCKTLRYSAPHRTGFYRETTNERMEPASASMEDMIANASMWYGTKIEVVVADKTIVFITISHGPRLIIALHDGGTNGII